MTTKSRTSIIDLLTPWAEKDPESVAAATPPGPDRVTLSKVRLLGEIGAARDRYLTADIHPGDRIVLIAPTCPEFLIEFFGAHAAGLVVVAVNPLSTVRELDYILADSGGPRARGSCFGRGREDRAAQHDVDFRTWPSSAMRAPRRGGADSDVTVDRADFAWDDIAALLYTWARRASRRGRC